MRSRRKREGGFALVTALWAAMILALVTSFVVKAWRTDAHIAHTRLTHAQDRALAQGAIELVKLRLLAPIDPRQLPTDGTPFVVTYAGHAVRVSVQDQAGLIDLNFAPAELLHKLFVLQGVKELDAQALTDRITDWREKSVGRRLNGAKAPDYEEAGYGYGPREAPFESVAELRLVIGMTPDIFDRVAPLLTVYSQKPIVETTTAPEQVLEALSGGSVDAASEVVRERDQARGDADRESPPAIVVGHSFEATATLADASGDTTRTPTAWRAMGAPVAPFWIYNGGD
jgi:general secretion pathway protein K